MSFNGIYIDDDPKMSALLRKLNSDELTIQLQEPSDLVKLADQIVAAHPDVVLLDYRLDELAGGQGETVYYRAAPLAQQMRDLLGVGSDFDFPIVLISSEDKIRTLFRPEKTAHDLFDWKFIKNELDGANKILIGLIKGYGILRGLNNNFYALSLFNITDDQVYLIDFQELKESLNEAESPHIAARYILNFLIRRPGLLLDKPSLLARLGIENPLENQAEKVLYEWLAPSRYTGVFADCGERWWSSLLEEQLESKLEGPIDAFTADERAKKLTEDLGQIFKPARNSWSKNSDFYPVFACAICQLATPLKNSLSCLDSRLPNFVHKHRVCFDCIQRDRLQESNALPSSDFKFILDETEQRIAEEIRSGKLTAERK